MNSSAVARAGRIRLVATDLDGTLLRSDGQVSPRTRHALARAEDAGIVVVFVTARPVRWVDALAPLVGGHGLVLCSNGAIVYDVRHRRVLKSDPLPVDRAEKAIAALRAGIAGIAFARESTDGFAKEPAYVERDPMPASTLVGPIEELLDGRTVKLLARHERLDPTELLRRTRELVGDLLTVSASSSTALVELSGPGVTKAGTLQRFCAERGIAADEVIALGDMLNDLPMLRWAGTAGAVANAHPDVLACADLIAPSNDEDGVAVVLEGLLQEAGFG